MSEYTQTTKIKRNFKVVRLFVVSLIFISIAIGIAVVGCNYVINRNFKETFYSVSSLKVNNKIRVVQISDLHNSLYGKENSKLINRIKNLKPDIIVYTGDIIDSKDPLTDNVIKLCAQLAEVAPSYYIYGNNEVEKYYQDPLTQQSLDEKFGFDDTTRNPQKLLEITDSLTTELEKYGVKVLKNKSETLTVGATNVDIYGALTSNPSSFWSYAGESFDSYIFSETNNFKITAIHEPFVFEEYAPDTWGDLMLSGHTHGGVVKIPMIGPLYTHGAGILPERQGHFVYGRYEVKGRPLIISAGLENKNFFRINNQPERVIVDINRF